MALLDRRLHPASLLPLYLHNDALVRFIASPVTTPLILYVADHARTLLMRDSTLVASLHPRPASPDSDAISITPSEASAPPATPASLPDLGIWLAQLAKQSGAATATIMVASVYIRRIRLALPIGATRLPSAFHRVLLAALILAAKMTHDRALKNAVWARYSGLFTTHDVTLMESQFLRLIDYHLCIDEPELLAVCSPLMLALGYTHDEIHPPAPHRSLSSFRSLSCLQDTPDTHWRPWSHQPPAHTRTASDSNVLASAAHAMHEQRAADRICSRAIGLRSTQAQTNFLSHRAPDAPSDDLGLGPPMPADQHGLPSDSHDGPWPSSVCSSSSSASPHLARPSCPPFTSLSLAALSPSSPLSPTLWDLCPRQIRHQSSTSTLSSKLAFTPPDGPTSRCDAKTGTVMTNTTDDPRSKQTLALRSRPGHTHSSTPPHFFPRDCPVDVTLDASPSNGAEHGTPLAALAPENLVFETNIDDISPVLPPTPHLPDTLKVYQPVDAAPTRTPTRTDRGRRDPADCSALRWNKIFPDPDPVSDPAPIPVSVSVPGMMEEMQPAEPAPNSGLSGRTVKPKKMRRQLSISMLFSSLTSTHSASGPEQSIAAPWGPVPQSAPACPINPWTEPIAPAPPAPQAAATPSPRLKTARSMPLLSRLAPRTTTTTTTTTNDAPALESDLTEGSATRFTLRRAPRTGTDQGPAAPAAPAPAQAPGLYARASALLSHKLRSSPRLTLPLKLRNRLTQARRAGAARDAPLSPAGFSPHLAPGRQTQPSGLWHCTSIPPATEVAHQP